MPLVCNILSTINPLRPPEPIHSNMTYPLSTIARVSSGNIRQNILPLVQSCFHGGAQISAFVSMLNIYHPIATLPMAVTLLTGITLYSSSELLRFYSAMEIFQNGLDSNIALQWSFRGASFIKYGIMRPLIDLSFLWCTIYLLIKQPSFTHDSNVEKIISTFIAPIISIAPAAAMSWLRYQHDEQPHTYRSKIVAYIEVLRGISAPAFTLFLLQKQFAFTPRLFYPIIGFTGAISLHIIQAYKCNPHHPENIFHVEKMIKILEIIFENVSYVSALYLLLETLIKSYYEGTAPASLFYLNLSINALYLILNTTSSILDLIVLQKGPYSI